MLFKFINIKAPTKYSDLLCFHSEVSQSGSLVPFLHVLFKNLFSISVSSTGHDGFIPLTSKRAHKGVLTASSVPFMQVFQLTESLLSWTL